MHGNISTHLPESDSESPSIVVHPLIGYLAPRQRRTPSQGSLSKRTRKSSYRRGHRRIASGTSLEKKPKHGTTTAPDRVVYIGQLHAANYGIGPGTSPYEQSPNQTDLILPEEIESDHSEGSTPLNPLQERKLQVAAIPLPSQERPAHAVAPAPGPTKEEPAHKKTIDDFTILEEMGRGAYGEVKLCQYKEKSSKKVVIKYITKRRILVETWAHDPRLGTVPLEIHVLDFLRSHDLQHPNIVEMADFFEDDINYYIEMVPHDLPSIDLFDYLELHTNMEEKECREIFVQIAEAVQFLHEKAMVVHRDIKDENIVLDNKGKIQLVDFGSAAYIKSGPFDVFVGTIGTLTCPSF
jgi:protein-serine/threonine kinase